MQKKYKFGIIKNRRTLGNSYRNIGICSCGQHIIGSSYHRNDFQCDACGNAFFIDARNKSAERFIIPYLEASRKDNRGFKITRTNLSVVYKDGFVTPVKENLKRTMEFDIVDNILKVWRADEIEYDFETNKYGDYITMEATRKFFPQLDIDVFLEFISSDVTRDFYSIVKDASSRGYSKSPNIIRGFARLFSYKHLQILSTAGVPNVRRFYDNGGRWHREETLLDVAKTKPHEILKVPKFMMEYIRQDVTINRYILQQVQKGFKGVDTNKFKEIMSIVKDEGTMSELSNCIDTIMNIHVDYDYTNLKKLVLYLFREARLTQGIERASDASTYLRDYIRMSRSMGLEWDKYPKSLKKEHDVVQMNYNMLTNDEKTKKEFSLSIGKKSYQNLAFEHKKEPFVIVLPEESQDLVKEGNQLSHCVASYVRDVNNDKCKIVFLRNKEEPDKPLVTIEVRGMNIRQARGFGNRSVTDEQKEFIKKWAEEKDLVEAYY